MSTGRAERLQQDFWDFACDRYEHPEVKQLCLRLQDEYGLSVNMLLFCLWQGSACRQVLLPEFFQHNIAGFEQIEREVVTPFRQQRRASKQQKEAPWLHKTFLDMELELERKAQAELVVALLASPSVQRASSDTTALINLGNYLKYKKPQVDEQLISMIKQLASHRE